MRAYYRNAIRKSLQIFLYELYLEMFPHESIESRTHESRNIGVYQPLYSKSVFCSACGVFETPYFL